jgi:hypothetical protein
MRQEQLEQLLESEFAFIALETDDPEQSIHDFRPLVREGKAIYLWDKHSGLRRMEASHISIPNTGTPEQVIKHIKQSKLYGIYLLMGFDKVLADKALFPLFKDILDAPKADKKLLFIDHGFQYPHHLLSDILITKENGLRD